MTYTKIKKQTLSKVNREAKLSGIPKARVSNHNLTHEPPNIFTLDLINDPSRHHQPEQYFSQKYGRIAGKIGHSGRRGIGGKSDRPRSIQYADSHGRRSSQPHSREPSSSYGEMHFFLPEQQSEQGQSLGEAEDMPVWIKQVLKPAPKYHPRHATVYAGHAKEDPFPQAYHHYRPSPTFKPGDPVAQAQHASLLYSPTPTIWQPFQTPQQEATFGRIKHEDSVDIGDGFHLELDPSFGSHGVNSRDWNGLRETPFITSVVPDAGDALRITNNYSYTPQPIDPLAEMPFIPFSQPARQTSPYQTPLPSRTQPSMPLLQRAQQFTTSNRTPAFIRSEPQRDAVTPDLMFSFFSQPGPKLDKMSNAGISADQVAASQQTYPIWTRSHETRTPPATHTRKGLYYPAVGLDGPEDSVEQISLDMDDMMNLPGGDVFGSQAAPACHSRSAYKTPDLQISKPHQAGYPVIVGGDRGVNQSSLITGFDVQTPLALDSQAGVSRGFSNSYEQHGQKRQEQAGETSLEIFTASDEYGEIDIEALEAAAMEIDEAQNQKLQKSVRTDDPMMGLQRSKPVDLQKGSTQQRKRGNEDEQAETKQGRSNGKGGRLLFTNINAVKFPQSQVSAPPKKNKDFRLRHPKPRKPNSDPKPSLSSSTITSSFSLPPKRSFQPYSEPPAFTVPDLSAVKISEDKLRRPDDVETICSFGEELGEGRSRSSGQMTDDGIDVGGGTQDRRGSGQDGSAGTQHQQYKQNDGSALDCAQGNQASSISDGYPGFDVWRD